MHAHCNNLTVIIIWLFFFLDSDLSVCTALKALYLPIIRTHARTRACERHDYAPVSSGQASKIRFKNLSRSNQVHESVKTKKLTLLISFQKILKVTQHLKDILTLLGRGEVRCCKFPLREKLKQIWKHKDSTAVFLN